MSFFINNYLWVLITFFQFFLVAWLSFRAQQLQTWSAFMVLWLMGLIPMWTLICRYSNNIALMGFVYDFVLAAGWTTGVVVFQGKSFSAYQYAGIGLMLAGILIFKR